MAKAVPAFFVENTRNISLYLHLILTVTALFTFIMHRMRSRPGTPLLERGGKTSHTA